MARNPTPSYQAYNIHHMPTHSILRFRGGGGSGMNLRDKGGGLGGY